MTKVVKLVAMDDAQAPKEGTLGYVHSIDDAGQIHVSWENGSSLALIPGQDDFEYVSNQEALNIFEKRFKDAQTSNEVIQAIKQLEKWDSEVHYVVRRSEWFNSAEELLSSYTTCTLDVKKAYACEANKILDSLEEAFKENGVKKDSLTLKTLRTKQ